MMMSLFSIFDPVVSENYSLNWFILLILFFYIPMMYWFVPSRLMMIYFLLMKFIYNELKILFMKINKFNLLIFISLILYILLSNLFGLFSYVFVCSSHLVFTFSIALPFWFSMMFYGWLNQTNKMFIHLVPLGTPIFLMFFMVIVETISNLIRPLTLSVRLSANMISGHLLMTLLGGLGEKLVTFYVPCLLIVQCVLMLLELAVCFIQSYVFVILISLYSQEYFYD